MFADPALERDYRHAVYRQTAGVMRFGILLAITLYLWFGAIDRWLFHEAVAQAWTIRGAVVAFSAAVFVASFREAFFRFRETVVALFMLLLASGLTAIIAIRPEVMDQYYVGHVLIIVGVFTIFGLRFPNALAVSLAIVALYLLSEFLLRDAPRVLIVNNATFLVSALVIAAIGSYAAERQRRLAYFRLQVIEQKRAASEHVALHDPLTGLPNRRLLLEKLEQAVARATRQKTLCAVLFIDLDGFKAVNDRHGHAFGDRLLKIVAQRVVQSLRVTDTAARYGGDEFVVVLEDIGTEANLEVLTERVRQCVTDPCDVDDVRLAVSCSIGIAIHPHDGATPRELLEVADASMYRMKRAEAVTSGAPD